MKFTLTSIRASILLTLLSYLSSPDTAGAASNKTTTSPNEFFGGQNDQDYLDWVESIGYKSSIYLPSSVDASEGVAIHWEVSEDEEYLELALAVRATGWFGFGISDNGGMSGSDMLLFEANQPSTVTDAYVKEERLPVPDDCQDWQLLSSNVDSPNFLMIQVRRKLVTGDLQDLPLRNDRDVESPVHRVIAAWGDEETVGFHGKKTARGALRWFTESGDEETLFEEAMAAGAKGSFFFGAENYTIKAQETEYAKFCVSGSQMREAGVPLDAGATLIGFEPVVHNTEHVHHYIVTAGYSENNNVTDCESVNNFDMVYAWAPGEPPLALPDNVGFALGKTLVDGQPGYVSFQVEIHYDNPELKEGGIDNSGVRLYYSDQPREHTAGFLIVGDSTVAMEGQPISQGLTDYKFDCPQACSRLALQDGPVTVMREYIHMHQSGAAAYNEQIRGGEVIRTGKAEYFDFKQQGAHVVQQDPFEIRSGDSFNTRCFFRNDEEGRKFGLASSDEMCMVFLLYYPRKSLAGSQIPWFCGIGLTEMGLGDCETTTYEERVLLDGDETPMQRTFGTPSTQCPADSENAVLGSSSSSPSAYGCSTTMLLVTALAAAASFLAAGADIVSI